jgi:Zn finger protein HypA/HybF involved in hydrogenase expression
MAPDRVSIGNCPKCGGADFRCSYNHFAREDLTIDSWEHRCLNCGLRETKAYRSDQPLEADVDVTACPFCGRKGTNEV